MSETSSNYVTLSTLHDLITKVLDNFMPQTVYLVAETMNVRMNYNGHCYLELVEKDKKGNNIIARATAIIWSSRYQMISSYFEHETGQKITSGMKILVEASVQFHAVFGYSIIINNIDPTYTLGEMSKRRDDVIKRLKQEGIFTMNQELEMPRLCRRIAIISSPTAAGYEDFCTHIKEQKGDIQLYTKLFPAVMQGDKTEASIIAALDTIFQYQKYFDAVVIIRGGGATSELAAFDSYDLCANCAQFPLPVISGIGHERDESVLDMVANVRVKTPTAAAAWILERLQNELVLIAELKEELLSSSQDRLSTAGERLVILEERLPMMAGRIIEREQNKWQQLTTILPQIVRRRIERGTDQWYHTLNAIESTIRLRARQEEHKIEVLQLKAEYLSPQRILKQGYSLTMCNGKIVTSYTQLKKDDQLVTYYNEGQSTSIVTQSEPES